MFAAVPTLAVRACASRCPRLHAQPDVELDGGLEPADALARSVGAATRALSYDRTALPEAPCAAQSPVPILIVTTKDKNARRR